MKRLLLVDDNEKYAAILTEYFLNYSFQIDRAANAAEGLALYRKNGASYYSVIVTDITMESQLAGIFMIRKIHEEGFRGTSVIASTGFDFPTGIFFSRLLLKGFGVDYLVPKTTVLKKEFLFYPVKGKETPLKEFVEIAPAARNS